MATQYPNGIDNTSSLPYVTNGVSPMVGDDVNRLRDAIVAVETELGANPSGTFTSVDARLGAAETAISDYANSTFLVLSTDGFISQERVFAPSVNFAVVDGGAGANYEIDLAANVGIGTLTPASDYSLTLDGDGATRIGGVTLRNAGTDTFYIGSAAASDSANISLMNPNTGYLALGTDGTERVRITSAGDIGLGTTSPAGRLHVSGGDLLVDTGDVGIGTVTPAGLLHVSGGNLLVDTGDVGIGTLSPAGRLHVSGGDLLVDTGDVGIGTLSPAGLLHVSGGDFLVDAGSVGIGTLTPSELMHVSGGNLLLESIAGAGVPYATLKGTQGGVRLSSSNGIGRLDVLDSADVVTISLLNDGDNRLVGANNTDFSFYTNNTEKMRLTATGELLVGTTANPDLAQVHIAGGAITHSSSQFNSRPGAGVNYEWINRSGAGHTWYVDSAGTQAMTLVSTGRLGIGDESTAPLAMLDVKSSTREVAYFRTTDTGVSSQLALSNASNLNAGVVGTVSGTGLATGDVYALGYAPSLASADFSPVIHWRSNGAVGINASPGAANSLLRIQQAGENNIGITVVREPLPTPLMALYSFDESAGFYRPLALDASETELRIGGNPRAVVTSDAFIVGSRDSSAILPVPNGVVRSPDLTAVSPPSNQAGSGLTIRSGKSTGIGEGGDIVFQVASGGVAGSSLNLPTTRMTIGSTSTSISNKTISIQATDTSTSSILDLGAQPATAGTKEVNIGTGSTGGTTLINIGSSIATTTFVNGNAVFGGDVIVASNITRQGAAGALNIGNSASVNAINIGTSSATGNVSLSRGTAITTINGNVRNPGSRVVKQSDTGRLTDVFSSSSGDPDLFLTVVSSGTYKFRAIAFFNTTSSEGVRFRLSTTSGLMDIRYMQTIAASVPANTAVTSYRSEVGVSDTDTSGTGVTTVCNGAYIVEGSVTFTSACDFQIEWAKVSAGPSTTSVLARSFLELFRA